MTKDYISSLVARSDSRIEYVEVLKFSNGDNIYYEGFQMNSIQLPILGRLDVVFQYRNVAVVDSINSSEKLVDRNITYYISDKARMSDYYEEITLNVSDEDSSVSEDRSSGYSSEFRTSLSGSVE